MKRGDLVRVRRTEAPTSRQRPPGSKPSRRPASSYKLDQLPRAQAALVSLEPSNGALRALSGGFSFAGNKFNRATQARRQPGSSFKPFVYAAAFERGYNPASIVLDAPVVFKDRRGHLWRPQNDTGNFAGPMRLREAMVQSRNLVSVRLLDAIGVDYARKYISHFGFEEKRTAAEPVDVAGHRLADAAVGGARLRRLRQRRLPRHAVVHRRGEGPRRRRRVQGKAGHRLSGLRHAAPADGDRDAGLDRGRRLRPGPGGRQRSRAEADDRPKSKRRKPKEDSRRPPADMVLAPRAIDGRTAYQIVSMLRDVVQRGTGTAAKVLEREDIGGKTGSTNDHRDAWFSGFGGPYVTTVWVGRDDFKSLGYREYGGKAALPIWIDYMRVALKDQPLAVNEPPRGHGQGVRRRQRRAGAAKAAAAFWNGSSPKILNAWRPTSTTARKKPCRLKNRLISSESAAASPSIAC